MVFRIRELLIRQRTQAINALRGHLTEFGQIVPQGAANAARLIAIVEDPDNGLPADAVATLTVLVAALSHLEAEIGMLNAEIERRVKEDAVARRLMTVPGIGPLIATAIAVLAPPPETFRKARDFAAWLGLVPRQHSTGGKQRLGATTKMGERSPAPIADHRRQQRDHQTPCPCFCPTGHMARRNVDAQATDAGACRIGKQNGADCLGSDGPRWRLQGSGRGGVNRPSVARASERKRARSSLAQSSQDGIGRTSVQQSAFEHAALIWTRPSDTIRARSMMTLQKRPDTCQHPMTRQKKL